MRVAVENNVGKILWIDFTEDYRRMSSRPWEEIELKFTVSRFECLRTRTFQRNCRDRLPDPLH